MTPTGPPVILLVEDDPNDIVLLRRAFRRAGVEARLAVAEDGDEAVRYLEGLDPFGDRSVHPLPDLVVLDLKLPRRSGHEVLEWLRTRSPIRRVPVVVLTSSGERDDVDRAYDIGANSYLVKPLHFDQLEELVKLLERYWLGMNQPPGLAV